VKRKRRSTLTPMAGQRKGEAFESMGRGRRRRIICGPRGRLGLWGTRLEQGGLYSPSSQKNKRVSSTIYNIRHIRGHNDSIPALATTDQSYSQSHQAESRCMESTDASQTSSKEKRNRKRRATTFSFVGRASGNKTRVVQGRRRERAEERFGKGGNEDYGRFTFHTKEKTDAKGLLSGGKEPVIERTEIGMYRTSTRRRETSVRKEGVSIHPLLSRRKKNKKIDEAYLFYLPTEAIGNKGKRSEGQSGWGFKKEKKRTIKKNFHLPKRERRILGGASKEGGTGRDRSTTANLSKGEE